MSDIPRYDLAFEPEAMGAFMEFRYAGKYVLYDAHVESIRQARAEGDTAGFQNGYDSGIKQGQRDVIKDALQRTLDALDSLNYEHRIDPDNCGCVACEDAAIILAAVKGEKFDIDMTFGIVPTVHPLVAWSEMNLRESTRDRSVPAGSGGMSSDVQMDEVEGL